MVQPYFQFIRRFQDEASRKPLARLANLINTDLAFPKQADNFQEISEYMETSSVYSQLMSTFDESWQLYQEQI